MDDLLVHYNDCLSLTTMTPASLPLTSTDDSLDTEDPDTRTHFPQFSYSASIRE